MNRQNTLLLAGDLGATKTTLALYDIARWPGAPLRQRTFLNADFTDFDSLLATFLDSNQPAPAIACLGAAGPVVGNAVTMTNLNWSIAAADLQTCFGFPRVEVINDLVATAMGALYLEPTDLQELNTGEKRDRGTLAVLAPGSGLGEAFLLPHNGTYFPNPSEGGHASFAPRNDDQIDLLAFMRRQHAHVSVEQVCSGLAIPDLLAFMATRQPIPDWLQDEMEQVVDRTPVIVQAAVKAVQGGRPCAIAVHALNLFLDILADEAANLALKTLALGGVFLGGGMTPRLLPLLDPHRFMTLFARGTYRDMLTRIPVHVIVNPETALLGAAAYGFHVLDQGDTDVTIP